jgi:predicted nucleic acid-binding protein
MTASPVLVDSSWYIAHFRQQRDPFEELLPIAMTRDVATCGIVRCEVARGIREPKLLRKMQAQWDVMLYVPTDNKLWQEAEALLWKLDRSGLNLPLQDVVIAACALRLGGVVLTHDKHFQQIPGIRATDRIV